MKTKADCYGKMFPDVIRMVHNEAITGKVFGYRVDQPGIGVTNRATTVTAKSGSAVWSALSWMAVTGCP